MYHAHTKDRSYPPASVSYIPATQSWLEHSPKKAGRQRCLLAKFFVKEVDRAFPRKLRRFRVVTCRRSIVVKGVLRAWIHIYLICFTSLLQRVFIHCYTGIHTLVHFGIV